MLVYDVGMHNGADTVYYLAKGARVVAVEADPDLCAAAATRFADAIAAGRLTILNLAVAVKEGEPAGARRLSSLFEEHGRPDFVRIDAPGAEHLVLAELREAGRMPRHLSVEAPDEALLELLIAAGFDAFRLVNGTAVGRRFRNHPITTGPGRLTRLSFSKHSSGPIGDDLPDPWVDAARLMEIWRERGALLGPGWYDVHARRGGGLRRVGRKTPPSGKARHLILPIRKERSGMTSLRRARVFLRPDWNLVVAGEGVLARASLATRAHHFRRRHDLGPGIGEVVYRRPAERVGADTPVVVVGGDNNYYHHLVDFMLRIFATEEPWPAEARFLLPVDNRPFFRPMREFFGLTDDRVILATASPAPLLCDRVLLPFPPVRGKGEVRDAAALGRARDFAAARLGSPEGGQDLYISRARAPARRLAEEEALWARLSDAGFRRLFLEEMSFAEQVAAFAGARTIVGVHGAGFANMVFTPPGAHVVEIMPEPGRFADFFLNLAPGCGHRLSRIQASGAITEEVSVQWRPSWKRSAAAPWSLPPACRRPAWPAAARPSPKARNMTASIEALARPRRTGRSVRGDRC